MRTISPPKRPRKTVQFTCAGCEAVMEVRSLDGRHDTDRDGAHVVFSCPHCGRETYLNVDLFFEGAS